MTIKKPMRAPSEVEPTAPQPTAGGATIADRFRLDIPDSSAKQTAGKGTVAAAIAGFVALAIAGALTYMLWQHWTYLMPA